ncbi:LOW QUALITY PROTEIN: uncharacterized protein PODANS_5_740 [Podospora anserina S mat+]|uniref:Podospora anserina S mat+ genomic DNA chromosome 5, supercontig 1 n=1 Tax=Podospora anserina (strain S / ATCC MYA-4624 / DSM 980 / FGSC 10383) TaxID=515849 RepID=B2AF26_PODAN|nr:LOW QUALITY PROTEIN: uncharacterized protein PODANS_5_740 [Podospora anserina S mat+]CAP62043.1 unnamed protein product [Podospora anserina S mat+]
MYLRCEVSHSTVKTNLPLTLKSRRDHRASFFTNLHCRQLKPRKILRPEKMYLAVRYAKKKYRQHRGQPPSSAEFIQPCFLLPPYTLQALDTTIIASALPSIVSDFDQKSQLNWLTTSFNLPSASFLPLWAQLVDIFGRYPSLQLSILILTVGSAICAASPLASSAGWGVMLFGRGVQGVGAAGMSVCVRTILADRVSLAEYAKTWTLFAVFTAVGFRVGPVVGGFLSRGREGWRWCFGVNVPVGAVGMGVVLFLSGMGLLILGLTWAGGEYAWGSVAVVVPLVAGGVLTVGWVGYRWAMVPGRKLARVFPRQRAMMPWGLLVRKDIGLLFAAMYSVMYFMDIYFVEVMGHDSSGAGLALLYFLPGMGVAAGVYMAMFWINVWPRQTLPAFLLGTVTSAVAISVLPYACWTEKTSVVYGMMALAGFGVGTNTNPGSLHGLAYFPHMTAAITCIVTFAVPFGGTIALTIMSTEGSHEVVHGAWLWSIVRGQRLEKAKMAGARDESGLPLVPLSEREPLRSSLFILPAPSPTPPPLHTY